MSLRAGAVRGSWSWLSIAALGGAVAGTGVGAEEKGAATQVAMALMRAIPAAFNSRDVERIVAFFAEDAVFYLARGPEPVGRALRGKAAIRKALSDRFGQIPDMRWD